MKGRKQTNARPQTHLVKKTSKHPFSQPCHLHLGSGLESCPTRSISALCSRRREQRGPRAEWEHQPHRSCHTAPTLRSQHRPPPTTPHHSLDCMAPEIRLVQNCCRRNIPEQTGDSEGRLSCVCQKPAESSGSPPMHAPAPQPPLVLQPSQGSAEGQTPRLLSGMSSSRLHFFPTQKS